MIIINKIKIVPH